MKKNVLFVVDEKRMGGVSILLEDILNNININKYNIDVLVLHNNGERLTNLKDNINIIYGTPYFSSVDLTIKEVIKTHNIKTIYHKVRVVFDMKTGLIKKSIIKERKKILNKTYDVEIAFKDGFTALFTIFGNSKKKIHWLQYEYNKVNPNAKYDKLFKKILPCFDQIIAISEGVKKQFSKIYNINNIKVIENYIDINKIITKSKEKGLDINQCDINFTSIGRLHPIKGYDRLIKIIASLKKDGRLPSNFRLRIYGNGPSKNELETLINDNNLKENVILMGQLSNPYKDIKNASLFILPSRHEAFGLVIIESMILKVPVLACENSATNKLIKSGFNGLVVKNNDNDLKEGLIYLLDNPNILKKYKKNLSSYKYDNEYILKQIEEELDDEDIKK